MSGIAGIVYPDVFQVDHVIVSMMEALQHRGNGPPDTATFRNTELGCVGGKIGCNQNKSIAAVLDGHIYNAIELHQELRRHGFQFHSDNPAEILVHAYDYWDHHFLEKLNGDFSLIIIDLRKRELFIARDRFGKKPLYWFQDYHHFLCASEIKSILATGLVPQTPALDALAAYLYFGYTPQDLTPIQKVNKLLPGHYLVMNYQKSVAIHPYWSYSAFFEHKTPTTETAIAKSLDHLLDHSVQARVQKEASGCFISGGLGSASTAYYLHKHKPDIKGFTVGFQGETEADIKAAKEAAEYLLIPDESTAIGPDSLLTDLIKMVWYLDEPLADPNIIATWQLTQAAAGQIKHVFSGMGCDELLSGHSRYTKQEQKGHFFAKLFHTPLVKLEPILAPIINKINPNLAFRLIKKTLTNPWQYDFLMHNSLFRREEVSQASPQLAQLFDPQVFLHRFHTLYRIKSLGSSFMYIDVKTRMPDCYILQYERFTAAHGLDWHTPYLDHKLAEYVASLPEPSQLEQGLGAIALKQILHNHLPENIINRPKVSRPHFLESWVASGKLTDIFVQLRKGVLVEAGMLSSKWIHEKTRTIEACTHNFHYLWGLLILEIWIKMFVNRPIQCEAPNVDTMDYLLEK